MAIVTKVVGTIGFVFKGDFSEESPYKKLNVVRYNNNVYVCSQDTTAGTLPTDTNYWDLFVEGMSITNYYTKEEVDSKVRTYTLSYSDNELSLTDQLGHKQKVTIESGGTNVSVEQTLTDGTEIATIIVDDVPTKIYAPSSSDFSRYFGIREFQRIFIEFFISEDFLKSLGYDTTQEIVDYLPYKCSLSSNFYKRSFVMSVIKQQKTLTRQEPKLDEIRNALSDLIGDDIYSIGGKPSFYLSLFLVKSDGYIRDNSERRISVYIYQPSTFKEDVEYALSYYYKNLNKIVDNIDDGDYIYALTYSGDLNFTFDSTKNLDDIQNLISSRTENTTFLYQTLSYNEYIEHTETVNYKGVIVRTPYYDDSFGESINQVDLYIFPKSQFTDIGHGDDYKTISIYFSGYSPQTKCACITLNSSNNVIYSFIDKMNDDETDTFIERY